MTRPWDEPVSKGKVLSIQNVKNEYLALLNEKSGKQSGVIVATGQDAKDEQKKEESATEKPFEEKSTPMKSMAQLYGGSTFGEQSGKEVAKGSKIVKPKKEESDQQTQSSGGNKSTGVVLNKTETDCDQQYGKSLNRTMMDDGYIRVEYEKNGINIEIIFNHDGYIDYISFNSKNEPFTEEQRKILLEKYSNNHKWESVYIIDLTEASVTVDGLMVTPVKDLYEWNRDDGTKAKCYLKNNCSILEITSINYINFKQSIKDKIEKEQKQKDKNKVDGL